MAVSAPDMARTTTAAPAAARPLAGRHAIVTGASRGIGAAVAAELARLGADLTLIARDGAALARSKAALEANDVRIHTASVDVTDEAAIARGFEGAVAALGAPAILVNNAGGAESRPFVKTDAALWRRMFALNVDSAFLCARAAAPAMAAAGWGRIVNVASTAGLKGYAYVSAYVAAKHALVGLTRALALEFARSGVTVNAVCPGYTETPMLQASIETITAKTKRSEDEARAALAAANPMGRLITPEEVAAAVGFLCLPQSASITGTVLPIAGGEVP